MVQHSGDNKAEEQDLLFDMLLPSERKDGPWSQVVSSRLTHELTGHRQNSAFFLMHLKSPKTNDGKTDKKNH